MGLRAQIAELSKKGAINKHVHEMAETVRIIGNDIAHPDAKTPIRITPDEVVLAQEFLRQLVDAVYIAPKKASDLRARLKKKGVPEA